MRGPNKEQVKAIEHSGGVLLNAGAGSGKTYVLIEHMYYLVSEFVSKKEELPEEVFKKELKNYLNKIVLMTFTNDAATEIRERLYKRFEGREDYPWCVVDECLTALNVSTIHGFCLKLIKQGFIPGAPGDIEIADEYQIARKIEILVEQWFEKNRNNQLNEAFVKNYDSILGAMQFIFASPELRAEWATGESFFVDSFDEGKFFNDLFEILELANFWKVHSNLAGCEEFEGKPWYELLNSLNTIKSRGEITWATLLEIEDIFSSIGRLVVSKKVSSELKDHVNEAKKIKDFMKSYKDDFEYFYENKEFFKTWEIQFKSLFDYIDSRYYDLTGVSFADLEYLVLIALKNDPDACKFVQDNFKYLIVDEYQDTSWIQFEIIKNVIGNDFNKLFCVGDRKQAIYGFRGGELGVFNETSERIPSNLFLKNNYRSEEAVVDFNNYFFEYIFALGREFTGVDNYSVDVDLQSFPDTKDAGLGSVTEYVVSVDDEELKRPSSSDINSFEATGIFNRIQSILKSCDEEICVLYKNLAPSKLLIQKLIKAKIPFEAQVKVPYSEDPYLSLFSAFVDSLIVLERSENEAGHIAKCLDYFNFFIKGISAHYFDQEVEYDVEQFQRFYKTYKYSGIESAFWGVVFESGLANSSYENNSKRISNIIRSASGNLNGIWKLLKSMDGKSYSTKFSYMTNPKVIIMTSHASKGLQFDNILLGGIHTNGRRVPNVEMMGKLPGSFRWSSDFTVKKLHRSPMYIFENLLSSHKEYSESKRLFYVACTRAVKNIEWINVQINGKDVSSSKESWINALRLYESEKSKSEIMELEESFSSEVSKSPLFFIDDLGISGRNERIKVGLVAELSVSKLALLAICSKKFYLSQILKLDDQWKEFAEANEVKINERQGISDTERGTRLHYQIEKLIKGEEVQSDEQDILDWVSSELSNFKDCELISERQMKFSFFGQMITGIPDLIIAKKGQVKEIWDFKSGLCDEDDKKSYLFQLLSYALGCIEVFDDVAEEINLKMVLLDQRTIHNYTISKKDVLEKLFNIWVKLSDINEEKISHCTSCQYGNLCHQ